MPNTNDTVEDAVKATVQFSINTGEIPVSLVQHPGQGSDLRSGKYEEKQITIYNGRPIASKLNLDRQGFIFAKAKTAVSDFYNEKEVLSIYYPEMEKIVMEQTDCDKVLVFDHTIRILCSKKGGKYLHDR